MKKIIVLMMCFSYLFSNTLDKNVVASVDGVKIFKSDLDRGVKSLFPAKYYHGKIPDDQMKAFEEKVLNQLIENELIYKYAKSLGIKVSSIKIDESIEKLKELLKTEDNFNKALSNSGFTIDSLRDSIEKEEVLKIFFKDYIESNPTDKELKEYYENNLYKFKEPERISIKIIYVKNDPTDPNGKAKAKERVEEAYVKIKDGADFADIAAEYSTAMSRINGGDLGYIHKGMLEPSVEKKAFSMDANETSEIIEEDIGFFIVKVEKKVKPNQLSFESIKLSLQKDLKKKFETEKKDKLLDRLNSKAVIIK